MSDDQRGEPRRQAARRERRSAGDRSARIARELMKLSASALGKIDLGDELRQAVDRARAVDSPGARRRAERKLAGDLRRADLDLVEARLASAADAAAAEPRLFKLAEHWRARLIEEGQAAAREFPGGAADPLPALVADAQREQETGRPRGARRALFRHIFSVLQAGAAKPADGPDGGGGPDEGPG